MICTPSLHAAEACDCSPMLRAALDYAARGWHVFPLVDKRPVVEGGVRSATTAVDTITAWWSRHPGASIGVACRPAGFVAIDVDPRNGGLETFAALERELGPLPRDIVQRSQSGGFHVLVGDPSPGPDGWTRRGEDGGEVVGKLGPGVDVKCNGYIVVHPSPGYEWQARGVLPPAPPSWIARLRKPRGEVIVAPEGAMELWARDSDGPLPLEDALRLRGELAAMPRKQGNGATYRAILTIFHKYGLSIDAGLPFLQAWNEACGVPHTGPELRRQVERIAAGIGADQGQRGHLRSDLSTAERVARAPAELPGNSPAAPGVVRSESPGDGPATNPEGSGPSPGTSLADLADQDDATSPGALVGEQPASPYVASLLQAYTDVQRLLGTAETGNTKYNEPMFLGARDIFTRQWPEASWRVRDLVTDGGVGVVATEPKSAKTWTLFELVIAVASGTSAFGEFPTKRGRCAYFFAEDMGKQVRNRGRGLLAGRNLTWEAIEGHLFMQPRGKFLDITNDKDLAWIVASARALGKIDVLALDPLRDVHSAKENDADEMSNVMRRLRVLSELLDCTVICVHHASKDSRDVGSRRPGQKMRGSGAIHGSIDSGIYLTDLETDQRSTFTNTVTSEVKGARSAGVFKLTLQIEDDMAGEAVKASWKVERAPAAVLKARAEETAAAEALGAVYRAIVEADGKLPWKQLQRMTKIKKDRADDARDRLALQGRIVECEIRGADGKLVPRAKGYRALCGPDLPTDEPAPPAPSSAGPHPIGAFVKDPE